jgi:hypothetical protein
MWVVVYSCKIYPQNTNKETFANNSHFNTTIYFLLQKRQLLLVLRLTSFNRHISTERRSQPTTSIKTKKKTMESETM